MKATPIAIIGLIIGIIGAALLGLFVASSTEESTTTGEAAATVPVLVARADLPADVEADALTGEQVRAAEVPESIVPEAAVTDLAMLGGQRTLRPIGAGEIITTTQFGLTGPTQGGFVVDDGYEAVSVEAGLAPGVEGYVTPGSRVNIYATMTAQTAQGETQTFTQLVLGHVNVLAVTRGTLDGQASQPTGQTPGTIVLLLEVRTEDAPVLIFAEQNGSLWYSLVNDEDPPPQVEQVIITDLAPAAREQAIRDAIEQQDARDAQHAAAEAAAEAHDEDDPQVEGDGQ